MKPIIDGHSHMFTESMLKSMGVDLAKFPRREGIEHSIQDNTRAWLEAMDNNGVEKTVFIATVSLNEDFFNFIKSSDRFIGLCRINPTLPDAIETLKKELALGMKGVKFFATNDGFDVGAQDAYPFYEYCQANNIPIVIHFGVTIGWKSDLFMGNPLRLSKVLKEFPKLNFIITHFGVGFFREVLVLKYKCDNLYVDTSGANNWLVNQDNFLTLKDVFKKTIEVFTPQRMIFGTDTTIFPQGYREHILKQQMDILNELGLLEQDKEDIMSGNARRVFGI